VAFVYKFLTKAFGLWASDSDDNVTNLYGVHNGQTVGLKGASISGDLYPEMMGVGYLIGPRIACMMMAGAVLSFFVLGPMIASFGENLNVPIPPAKTHMEEQTLEDGRKVQVDKFFFRNTETTEIYTNYLRYI